MGKKISGKIGPTFGLNSSVDVLVKLRHDGKRLREDWSEYDAYNFLVTAWHLFQDWHKSDPKFSLSRSKRRRKNLPDSMNVVLDVIRDLVNGSKHFELDDRSAEKRRVSETHQRLEADFYSFLFHEDTLGVSADGGWYFSIRVLHNILLAYFDWVFDDKVPVKEFPQQIESAILYCNIPKREGNAPALWAEYEG